MGDQVDISVVIPARNAASCIGQQLDALLSQVTTATVEFVVADNGSTDGTADVVRSFCRKDPRVRIVGAAQARGINIARNAAIRAARGGFVLITDADDRVQPGWIEAFWQAFGAGAQCVGGGVDYVLPDGQRLGSRRVLNRLVGCDTPFPVGANCGFPVEVFHRVGGFDESYVVGCTEVEFFWRAAAAGFTLTLVADAVIDRGGRDGLRSVMIQRYGYGRGWVRVMHEFGLLDYRALIRVLALHFYRLAGISARPWRPHSRRFLAECVGHIAGICMSALKHRPSLHLNAPARDNRTGVTAS